MHIDKVITTLRAASFGGKLPALAREAGLSDDQLRRILSDDPPDWVNKVRRLHEVAARREMESEAVSGAVETGGALTHE